MKLFHHPQTLEACWKLVQHRTEVTDLCCFHDFLAELPCSNVSDSSRHLKVLPRGLRASPPMSGAAATAKSLQSCLTLCNPIDSCPPGSPSLGFSRQEHWSGLPFPSPVHESESENEVAQSCLTLRDPMDCSLPGSSVHGIFQARVLEWGAIAFST